MRLDIAFDIDGCFVDIMSLLNDRLAKCGISILDNGKFEIECDPPQTVDQLWNYFVESYAHYEKVPIYPGARDLCDILFGMSRCPIQFVTGRPSYAATHTHLLIERFCKVPYTISFTGHHDHSKLDYLNGYKFFVEDRRKTAREIAMTGRTVYVPNRPWNQMEYMPGIVRIDGIHDLIENAGDFISGNKS
jgi:hypothetical protein